MTQILDNKILQLVLSVLIIGTTALCIFTPDVFVLKQGANFTVQIMFLFLLLGMVFLVVQQNKLMFTSLGACVVLCLHLKSLTDQGLRFPIQNQNPQISVAHIDLSLSDDYNETMRTIWATDVDLISFQEFTPYWEEFLPEELKNHYPYQVKMTRIDPYGMAIFSKHPLCQIDTLQFDGFQDIPSMHAGVQINEETVIHVVSTHALPPVNEQAYQSIRSYFAQVGSFVDGLKGPAITLGDFSLPPWSDEITHFKQSANMSDSRRDIVTRTSGKPIFWFNIPIDHIFYTKDFECTAFNTITGETASHMGIAGKYQLKALASLSTEETATPNSTTE